jgi:hypothetical protein
MKASEAVKGKICHRPPTLFTASSPFIFSPVLESFVASVAFQKAYSRGARGQGEKTLALVHPEWYNTMSFVVTTND